MFIKDGGYNSTIINKQLSPAQNTPKLQATKYINDPYLYRPSLQSPTVLFLKKKSVDADDQWENNKSKYHEVFARRFCFF